MKNFNVEIKWAIIFSIMNIVWLFMEKKLGWHDEYINKHSLYTTLIIVPTFIVYFLASREKKITFFKNVMTWRQSFISGLILSVCIAILSPFIQYINSVIISPNFYQSMITYSVENKIMSATNAKHYFTVTNYMFLSAVGSVSLGVVISSIVSLYTKTKTLA